MNCATRLVDLFGSQAEVARRFRLDRAVVNHWVKSGYVPARWAMEVEQVTGGEIAAVEVLNEKIFQPTLLQGVNSTWKNTRRANASIRSTRRNAR